MKEYAYIHEEGNLPPVLKDLPLVKNFEEKHLNIILYSSYFMECDPEDCFIEEGTNDSRMYVLLTGTIRVEKNGETLIRTDVPGELFGEIAVFNAENRSASVIAETHSLLLVVDQKFLQEIKPVRDNGSFYAAVYGFLAKIMANRLKVTSGELARVEKELEETKAALAKYKEGAA
ncbi:MAG: CRP/FNR family cyclic AMP-dependent transcriptional regulator [Verrucomicrobiales bacterium]|jgi:CRP/FNR family cyclic AMP-dependent transcriptional regulator